MKNFGNVGCRNNPFHGSCFCFAGPLPLRSLSHGPLLRVDFWESLVLDYTQKSTISTLAAKLSVSAIIYPRWTATSVTSSNATDLATIYDSIKWNADRYCTIKFMLMNAFCYHMISRISYLKYVEACSSGRKRLLLIIEFYII